ncbi:nicotinic acid mononucleotide adenyltransferase [Capnocytophaga cynodegmi]|uniref:nicotinic acid mononucleotide adenyltransferase n=1 Tax=Capnocytophaga cynodegmi TaxID=28189 RepID=UPI00385AE95D
MKRLLFFGFIVVLFLNSCSVRDEYDNEQLTLYDFLHSYDLWFVNVDATRGSGRIPFLQKAFTITFDRNTLLANNNLVGIGSIGRGYGRVIGNFFTTDMYLTFHHDRDGSYRFKIVQVSPNQIDLYDVDSNSVYRLEGYYKRDFNYDRLFFENMRYFLQEYNFWEKTYTSREGAANPFDNENFIKFYSLNGDYFFETSEHPNHITPLFRGLYNIENIRNTNNVKILNLNYRNETESFEIRILNDSEIELYHINSRTTYRFRGVQNIVYKKLKE